MVYSQAGKNSARILLTNIFGISNNFNLGKRIAGIIFFEFYCHLSKENDMYNNHLKQPYEYFVLVKSIIEL